MGIDWSFVKRDQRLEIGSVKELAFARKGLEYITIARCHRLTCNDFRPPTDFFSRLAETDTMRVNLVDLMFWREGNNFLKAMKAERLQIECELVLSTLEDLLDNLRDYGHGVQRTFTVDTIECLVKVDSDYPVPQPRVFENSGSMG